MAKNKAKKKRQVHKAKTTSQEKTAPSTTSSNSEAAFTQAFNSGTQLLHGGQVEAAIPLLETAVSLNPTHINAGLNLGGAYILSKKFSKAVTVLEPVSVMAPDHAMVWTNLGAAYLGNPVLATDEEQLKAIDAFHRALGINPIAPNVAYNLGLIYRDRQDDQKAIYWFEQAIKHDPTDQDARSMLQKLSNPAA